ncbi:hypothetical protein [Lysobacter arvi]|uniref:Uncharacterized protein n=1 Tax=Lysobacter arvi TaxID=3038776 RepID=A0ABU1CC44_9GAMM|nr:hypothetical protein [Lysobacter arvi]MDR0182723.1 hypothetical protein [Lysobacter arvi]
MRTARRFKHTGFGALDIGTADSPKSIPHHPASSLRGEPAPSI